jgi:hypothetical protein
MRQAFNVTWSTWSRTFEERRTGLEQLLALIAELQKGEGPHLLQVWQDSERELGVGLGRKDTV